MTPPGRPSPFSSGDTSTRTVSSRGPVARMVSMSPKILPALEACPDHPPEPVVLAHQIGHRRRVDVRHPEHRLGRRVDDLGLHRGRQHDDAVGQAVDNVVPEIKVLSPVRPNFVGQAVVNGLGQPT